MYIYIYYKTVNVFSLQVCHLSKRHVTYFLTYRAHTMDQTLNIVSTQAY